MESFLSTLGPERVWGQLLISAASAGFSVRHIEDRSVPEGNLKPVVLGQLRKLASSNAAGQFRPLRLAPDLVRGWFCLVRTNTELWRAIQEIYPGSIPDWYAAEQGAVRATDYRDYTNRQTGMYRVTQLLSDEQAAQVIRACCHSQFCLKKRLWSVNGLPPDGQGKSAIPCLEPCAVLLELARKAARIEQEEKSSVQLSRSELESLILSAKALLQTKAVSERVGNVGAATNPRRLQLVVEKYGAVLERADDREE